MNSLDCNGVWRGRRCDPVCLSETGRLRLKSHRGGCVGYFNELPASLWWIGVSDLGLCSTPSEESRSRALISTALCFPHTYTHIHNTGIMNYRAQDLWQLKSIYFIFFFHKNLYSEAWALHCVDRNDSRHKESKLNMLILNCQLDFPHRP